MRRVVLGALADGHCGLRISKAGFDANANPPVPANLIFDSQWPQLLPIHQLGVFSIAASNSGSVTFPALSYIPMFSVAIRGSGGSAFSTTNWAVNTSFETQPYTPPNGGTPISYLQIWVTASGIAAYNFTSGKDPTWFGALSIAYVIYKVPGG